MFLKSTFFNPSEYISVAFSKTYLVDGRLDGVLANDLGDAVKNVFGWLEFLCIHDGFLAFCRAHTFSRTTLK